MYNVKEKERRRRMRGRNSQHVLHVAVAPGVLSFLDKKQIFGYNEITIINILSCNTSTGTLIGCGRWAFSFFAVAHDKSEIY